MTFGDRIKNLRVDLELSQDALGSQGFVSSPGWIKLENGQRQASEKLIENLLKWLVSDKHIKANAAHGLREELLTLKYLSSNSLFVRELAKAHAKKLPNGSELTAEDSANRKPRRRDRPPGKKRA